MAKRMIAVEDLCEITGESYNFMADRCVLRNMRGAWINGLFVPASAINQPHGYGVENVAVIHCNYTSFHKYSTEQG